MDIGRKIRPLQSPQSAPDLAAFSGLPAGDFESPGSPSPLALYIHIPFCETKCNYCNFNTYSRLGHLVPGYVKALEAEIAVWGERLGHPAVHTVFLGGGTPSWLPAADIGGILDAAREAFALQPDAEVSAEANPGDVTPEHVAAWRAMGINRVSMGVQSFDDGLLRMLSRRHTAAQAIAAFRTLQAGGYDNLNIDLMYGLQHQSLDTWKRTMEQALALDAAHLSLYALTVEEGTPMWKDVQKGILPSVNGDNAADMYEAAESALGAAGYEHYEISNWAKPGHECRHNLVYWRNGSFLGVGPGAHSYLDGARFWNLNSPAEYIKRMGKLKPANPPSPFHPLAPRGGKGRGEVPWRGADIPVVEDRHPLDAAERLTETLILALRLDEGLAQRPLADEFGDDAMRPHLETLRRYAAMGLLTEVDGLFRLTARGRLLSNEVFVRLLPE